MSSPPVTGKCHIPRVLQRLEATHQSDDISTESLRAGYCPGSIKALRLSQRCGWRG